MCITRILRSARHGSRADGTPGRSASGQFATARSTLLIDRSMTWFITIGGLGVIIAVLGIFVFILSQILPLFQGREHAAPAHGADGRFGRPGAGR